MKTVPGELVDQSNLTASTAVRAVPEPNMVELQLRLIHDELAALYVDNPRVLQTLKVANEQLQTGTMDRVAGVLQGIINEKELSQLNESRHAAIIAKAKKYGKDFLSGNIKHTAEML